MVPPPDSESLVKAFQLGDNESGDVPVVTSLSKNIPTRGSEWRMFLRTGTVMWLWGTGTFSEVWRNLKVS